MANKQYQKGVRLEREIVNTFKAAGWNAVRTAGSHGKIDIVVWKKDMPGRRTSGDILREKGFSYFNGIFTRTRAKYQDKLYGTFILGDNQDIVILLQAKRKAVKHG